MVIAKLLRVLAWANLACTTFYFLDGMAGTRLLVRSAQSIPPWYVLLMGVFSGLMMLGFAEVIALLHRISERPTSP